MREVIKKNGHEIHIHKPFEKSKWQKYESDQLQIQLEKVRKLDEQLTKYRIAQCDVSYEQYQELSNRRYTVDCDPVGKERDLRKLEIFAYSKEYQEHYPDFAKACQDILNQVREEITGKKVTTMSKHNTFKGYFEDVEKLHDKAAEERRKINEDMQQAKEKYDSDRKTYARDEYNAARVKMEYLDAQKAYTERVKALKEDTQESLKAIKEGFTMHLKEFYGANGAKINDDTVKLLNSGIKLTDEELSSIANDNMSNPTMLRIIGDYCHKNGIKNNDVILAAQIAMSNGTKELAAFNGCESLLAKTYSDDIKYADRWCSEENYRSIYQEQSASMDMFRVRPIEQ